MKRGIALALCVFVLAAGTVSGCGRTNEPSTQEPVQNEQQEEDKAESMQEELDEVPQELPAEDAAARGFYTIANGEVLEGGGEDVWESFLEADAEGREASVVVCQYTREGDPILDYVYRGPEGGYLVVSDSTRDELATEANLHRTQNFECLNMFENFKLTEDGKEYTVCVLSNEPEMDEETFRTYWREMSTEAHQVYLLFVI